MTTFVILGVVVVVIASLKQTGNRHVQRQCDPVHGLDRWIGAAVFDAGQHRFRAMRKARQFLQRQALEQAQMLHLQADPAFRCLATVRL